MNVTKQRLLALSCGGVTTALHVYIIPTFFMRGVPDPVWIVLMALLPAIAAVALLHIVGKCQPKSVFWSLLVECALVVIFYRGIGGFLGWGVYSPWDILDIVQYGMFALGCAFGAALTQFVVLLIISKRGKT